MKNSANSPYAANAPTGPLPGGSGTPIHVQGVSTTDRLFFHRKSLLEAYIYCVLFGLFGMHHFYLKRHFFGWMYLASLGLLGLGWIIDLFRLPWLVKEANREEEEAVLHGFCVARQQAPRFIDLRYRTVLDAYIMWFPMGLFGWHQFYLGRMGFGVTYCCSAGLFGVGWLTDIFRIPYLVQEANEKIRRYRNREVVEVTLECSLGDAYQLAFPFGFLGLHHFYMGRIGKGLSYLFTGGLLCIGWLTDLIRMPCLVSRHNKEVRENRTWMRHLDDAYTYAIPLGILGFHRFYLGRPAIGLLYFFTVGLLGFGWLTDLVRMPRLVRDANERERMRCEIVNERVYVFHPNQASPSPQLPSQVPSPYGTINQQYGYQRPYPSQQGNLTFIPYNLPDNPHGQTLTPAPANPILGTYLGPPPDPSPYGNVGGPQPSVSLPPPPYSEGSGDAPSALPPDYKPGESQA